MSSARRPLNENRIQESIEDGGCEPTPELGQPLDIREYFDLPALDRLGYSMLKRARALPPEVAILREVEELERSLRHSRDPIEAAHLRTQIRARRNSFASILDGRRSGRSGGGRAERPSF